jgi:F0F1-type ATP synthase membrane subunit b/b'
MNQIWLLYTGITVAYILILVIYFLRRSKSHESELNKFLSTAKQQLELHKQETTKLANTKVVKASQVMLKVQEAIEIFENHAQEEYDQIIEQAKDERKQILASAKTEIEELFAQAELELEEYRESRHREIEKNLVKMVMSVAEKVVGTTMDLKQHQDLIRQTLEEIKAKKARS